MSRLPAWPDDDHVCGECGFSYPATSRDEAVAIVASGVPELARLCAVRAPGDRSRPRPETWSALEYLCHVRDVVLVSAIRLHRVVREDRPQLEPMYNDWRATRFGYQDEDAQHVLAELGRAVAGFRDEVRAVPAGAWSRTGGRFADEQRTAEWFVRHAAHEVRHHVDDVRRLLVGP